MKRSSEYIIARMKEILDRNTQRLMQSHLKARLLTVFQLMPDDIHAMLAWRELETSCSHATIVSSSSSIFQSGLDEESLTLQAIVRAQQWTGTVGDLKDHKDIPGILQHRASGPTSRTVPRFPRSQAVSVPSTVNFCCFEELQLGFCFLTTFNTLLEYSHHSHGFYR